MLDIKRVLAAKPKPHEKVQLKALFTPWGENLDVEHPLPEHPRPQFKRSTWKSLNGVWECAFERTDASAASVARDMAGMPADDAAWMPIVVPFSPEAPLSGVNRQLQPSERLWYRVTFFAPDAAVGQGVASVLHFEAVDYRCSVWLNGAHVGSHEGGYLSFQFDAAGVLRAGANDLVVCVVDPTEAETQPRGKQRIDRGDIFYTGQSGIWQSVWLEWAPAAHVQSLQLDPRLNDRLDEGVLVATVCLSEPGSSCDVAVYDISPEAYEAGERANAHVEPIAACTTRVDFAGCAYFEFDIPQDKLHLWTPSDPRLYTVVVTCGADVVQSYCGFRTAQVHSDAAGTMRFFLNGQPVFLRGALDQGYWSDGLMTAPADDALVFDIVSMRDAGFNMLRKHIKVESARWYYHADRLGMLVWQDMVSGGAVWNEWHVSYKPTLFSASWGRYRDDVPSHQANLLAGDARYREEWTRTARETIEALRCFPSVVTWVLFNEGWGQFDARAAFEMARAADPTRPIDAVSGWYDQHCGDYLSIHNYFRPHKVWHDVRAPRACVISEFGGLTLAVPDHTALDDAYGYAAYDSRAAWQSAVRAELAQVDALEQAGLAGFVYTQVSDVEEEVNGILTYDRRVNKLK